jgi:hypothetical protein
VARVSAGFSATASATIPVLARIVPASWRRTAGWQPDLYPSANLRAGPLGACRDGSSRRAGGRCGRLFSRAGGMCAGAAVPTPGRSTTYCRSSWAAGTSWPTCGPLAAAAIRPPGRRWETGCGVARWQPGRGGLPGTGEKTSRISPECMRVRPGWIGQPVQPGAIRWLDAPCRD